MRSLPALSALATALVLATSSVALAKPPTTAAPVSEADRKFDEALNAMKAGRYAEACPVFAESYQLDPQLGALFTLAECEYKWGKLVLAKTHYIAYLTGVGKLSPEERGKQSARERIAVLQRDTLVRDVPTLAVALKEGTQPGGIVKRNGTVMTPDDTPVELDPGEYVIEWTPPVGDPSTRTITLAIGKKERIELETPKVADETPKPAPKAPSSGITPRRIATYATGGLAVVAVGTGTVLGILALGKKSDVDANCNGGLCSQDGLDALSSGRTLGWVSTGAFVVAGAAAAVSLILFFTEPRAAERTAPTTAIRF